MRKERTSLIPGDALPPDTMERLLGSRRPAPEPSPIEVPDTEDNITNRITGNITGRMTGYTTDHTTSQTDGHMIERPTDRPDGHMTDLPEDRPTDQTTELSGGQSVLGIPLGGALAQSIRESLSTPKPKIVHVPITFKLEVTMSEWVHEHHQKTGKPKQDILGDALKLYRAFVEGN